MQVNINNDQEDIEEQETARAESRNAEIPPEHTRDEALRYMDSLP